MSRNNITQCLLFLQWLRLSVEARRGDAGATIAIIFFATSVFAQSHETPDTIRYKALGCLYNAIKHVNQRNARLQGLQQELEAMQPLAPQNMDSVHFAENLFQTTKYLRFLEQHRQEMQQHLRILTDSIHYYEKQMNQEDEKEALVKFLAAYKEEVSAFTGYSQRLSLMLTDIRSALTFLQTVPMTRDTSGMVTFNTDRSANEKYLDYESKISADETQVDQAIERTVKVSEKENKIITEATGLFNR